MSFDDIDDSDAIVGCLTMAILKTCPEHLLTIIALAREIYDDQDDLPSVEYDA